MKRRDFLSKSIGAGIAAGTGVGLLSLEEAFAGSVSNPQAPYDLVAVMGGEPEVMFERGIAALGGMRNYVKSGQTVVVKPNMAWDRSPEHGANTHPGLVGRIVRECVAAGAKEVFVLDHTCDEWRSAYATSGIERAARDAGARVITGNSEGNYKEVTIPGGKSLKTTKVHERIMDCDVFINVPVLKHHNATQITVSMKNLMGIIWDRGWWHRNDLHQCIADMVAYRKPDLNIVDAYRVMRRNGPKGVSVSDATLERTQILSADIVAADAAAARVFGLEPQTVAHIRIGDAMGFGVMDTSKLNISRIRV